LQAPGGLGGAAPVRLHPPAEVGLPVFDGDGFMAVLDPEVRDACLGGRDQGAGGGEQECGQSLHTAKITKNTFSWNRGQTGELKKSKFKVFIAYSSREEWGIYHIFAIDTKR